ncbi:hypothetical protein [Rhizocola hellebori]|uniref:hypothetical protein n=1 Tax=Rhizocola hellebori TaxID=1392758 RepID=UPI001940AA63|nr:hypothetical protein [Rhizocola hellebori]
MSTELAQQVADTILLEGYVLYPYRASAQKNQIRWQFGVIFPSGHDEPHRQVTECLIELGDKAELDLVLRFLQLQRRWSEPVWDEGVLREVPAWVALDPAGVDVTIPFTIDAGVDSDGTTTRQRWPLSGEVHVTGYPLEGPYGLMRLRIEVTNTSGCDPAPLDRPDLLRHSLITAHSLLAVTGATFVSLLEPPEWAKPAVASCVNEHTFPVLVGEGRTDVMLSSPIILYDYPQIAPESPGDLCDATEMDEMLVLRTLTLTDDEKHEARATDARSAEIIDRVESMPPELLDRLHGAIRYLRRVGEPEAATVPVPWWDPGADSSVSPETDRIAVPGGEAGRGSRVRLRPRESGTDAQDMFLRDRTALVEAVLSDVDGATHLAVTLEDDPAGDLLQWQGRYLYFSPEEVELLGDNA